MPSTANPERPGLQRAAVVAVVVLLIAALAFVVVRTSQDSPDARALVVGDSVTFISTAEIGDAFDGMAKADVQGRVGFRTDEILPVALDHVASGEPDIVVVLTGYNDLEQEVDTTEAVGEMMDLAASTSCAVWVLLPTKGTYEASAGREFNDRVEQLAAEHPNVHIEDGWRDAVDDTDNDLPNPELISGDHTHPLPAGSERLAQVEADAVRRHCSG